MPFGLVLFCTAFITFIASAFGVLYALEAGAIWAAWLGFIGMGVAAVLFLASALVQLRRVDWGRIGVEQRLWESGPLGQAWLKLRQRLSRLWKL